ncbi:MAG: DUF4349 domain-containing protein [Anaerolineales bacterium]|nr:DUF4349 domain-containing protein [Anaerolineales bacterium]
MRKFSVLWIGLLALMLGACAAGVRQAPQVEGVEVVKTVEVALEKEVQMVAPTIIPTAAPYPMSEGDLVYQDDPSLAPAGGTGGKRLIIKNAEMRLLVQNTETAIDRMTQVVDDLGGYIISSRQWFEENYGESHKYATYTIGVPVDQFEQALRRLRELSVRVLDENATGQDVTDEYVDLQSRLDNLKATRDRVRAFLDQAKTVDEALKINEQLSEIEDEINQVLGRMNYLFDRAGVSTITITFEPDVVIPTPTPTATPTPTPTPTPWNPGNTMRSAVDALGSLSRGGVEAFIWFVIVGVPCLGVPAAIVYGVWRLARRRKAKPVT